METATFLMAIAIVLTLLSIIFGVISIKNLFDEGEGGCLAIISGSLFFIALFLYFIGTNIGYKEIERERFKEIEKMIETKMNK